MKVCVSVSFWLYVSVCLDVRLCVFRLVCVREDIIIYIYMCVCVCVCVCVCAFFGMLTWRR
jgi:hypothetical protein